VRPESPPGPGRQHHSDHVLQPPYYRTCRMPSLARGRCSVGRAQCRGGRSAGAGAVRGRAQCGGGTSRAQGAGRAERRGGISRARRRDNRVAGRGGAGRVPLMRTVAVVLAGGTGERFGTSIPKQLLPFAGRPLIEHSVAAFDEAPAVDSVLVVMAARHAGQVREVLAGGGYRKLAGVIPGGPSRVESTRCAIGALGGEECDVLFHDAARPL